MVARAHGDDAATLFLVAQLCQLVAGAAFLERGGELQVLELQKHLRTGDLRNRARFHARRVEEVPLQALRGLADVGQVDHSPNCHGKSPAKWGIPHNQRLPCSINSRYRKQAQ
jgi:hypothetical protein